MTLPGQMELATVVDHGKRNRSENLVSAWVSGDGLHKAIFEVCDHGIRHPHECGECEAEADVPVMWLEPVGGTSIDHWSKMQGMRGSEQYTQPLYDRSAHKDTHKPAGVRLAKMLSQYDDSPSSQLWSDIQRLAREILK